MPLFSILYFSELETHVGPHTTGPSWDPVGLPAFFLTATLLSYAQIPGHTYMYVMV